MVPLTRAHEATGRTSRDGRRGVLLLIVLSMLTLFVLLGSTYLVVTMRARRVSQAFANKITAPAAAGPAGAGLVDRALLTVLRGTDFATAPAGLRNGDDLLGDKYGTVTVTGRITSIAAYDGSSAFLAVATTNLNPAPADVAELPGRVVTLAMPGLCVSTRILRATGTAAAPLLVITAGPTVTDIPISLTTAMAAFNRASGSEERRIVINGREFDDSSTNEPWDAFDGDNPLLTRILPPLTLPGPPTITEAPVLGGATLDVDNDSDGVLDSTFLDLGLPVFTNAAGVSVQPRAAFLVVDLDGRVNLNTHGDSAAFDAFDPSLPGGGDTAYPRYASPDEIPGNSLDDDGNGLIDEPNYHWDSGGSGSLFLRSLPVAPGSPATTSVAKSDVLREAAVSAPNSRSTTAVLQTTGRAEGGLDDVANKAQRVRNDIATDRPLPAVGGLEGRYGSNGWSGDVANPDSFPRPGRPLWNDPLTEQRERWTVTLHNVGGQQLARSFFTHPGRYGTPPDIKGRMRVWADPKTGQSIFYKPYWDENARGRFYDNEVVDDPYEIDLTPRGARIASVRNQGTGGTDINNPFTAADLEGLLRYYDPDSPRLSRRLVAVNDAIASTNRLTVTTESWDTPAITGDAWREVISTPSQTLLGNPSVNDFFAPETIMGHRLDLNRPFHDTDVTEPNDSTGIARRQEMARHIYCLLVGVAVRNGLPTTPPPPPHIDPDQARRLAQYAVNIVDFRDADSIMTLFRYDPNFTPGSTTWNPTEFVWGCERPEVLITETYAWHDRNTDDEAVGGSVRAPEDDPQRDSSFDQIRRPRGAFFVELTSPWGGRAFEYDSSNTTIRPVATPSGSRNPFNQHRADILAAELVSSEDRNGNSTLDLGEDTNRNGRLDPGEDTNGDGLLDPGEDRNDNGVLDPAQRDRLYEGIDLQKTVTTTGDPVWRLASVRGQVSGGTAFGTDPLSDATANQSYSIVDPSTPGSPATIDRVFYFTRPSPAHFATVNGTIPGGVFWEAVPSTTPLTPGHLRVVGTNAPFDPGQGPCAVNVAGMLGPGNKPATLTEPLVDSNVDPYHRLMQALSPANMMTPDAVLGGIAASWNTAIDQPLDSYGPPNRPFPGSANVESEVFIDAANSPILMINGTHENFAVIHLQRLADPTRPWNDTVGSSAFNPYITVDAMPVDLNVVNSVRGKPVNDPVMLTPPLPALDPGAPSATANYDDPSAPASREYGRPSDRILSVERGGRGGPGNDERDIWSRRVNPAVPSLRDANAFRTSQIDELATPPDPAAVPSPRPLPPAPRHTLTGRITGFRITNRGTGYSSAPNVSLTGPGMGVRTRAVVQNEEVVAIEVVDDPAGDDPRGGSGYSDPSGLTVTISGGGGSGAAAIPIVGGKPTRWNDAAPYAALFWPNRPFENLIELSLVPVASPFHLTQRHSIDDSSLPNDQKFFHLPGFWEDNVPPDPAMGHWVWRYVTGRLNPPPSPGPFSLLDFVHVRSRFANLYPSVPTGAPNVTALLNLGLDRFPGEQLSSWREPGRININTIVDGDGPGGEPRGAWRALFGGLDALGDVDAPPVGDRLPKWLPEIFGPSEPPSDPQGGTQPVPRDANPVRALGDVFRFLPLPPPANEPNQSPQRGERQGGFLDVHTNPTNDAHRLTDRHAYFRYQTMMNLSDRITTRSNVYAIWITIGYFDSAGNEIQPVQRNRGFYIVDRSIPVAYERGQDHNVRDAIRLRRIIQ